MLHIRKEQMDELGNISLKRFEDSMVEHVKEFFPKYYEILGEPTIRKTIQYGIECAESHDLITQRDVCLYINLVFLLGSNFDRDPQLPWAVEILNDETITDPTTRIDSLHDKAMEYLNRAAGKENEYLGRAMLRVREIAIEDFAQTTTANATDVAAKQLQIIWPTKCREMSETTLYGLIKLGTESAKAYNITSERGIVLYTTMMFLLGSNFDNNPQFPWSAKVLNDQSILDEGTRVDRLHKEAMAFLEKWLT